MRKPRATPALYCPLIPGCPISCVANLPVEYGACKLKLEDWGDAGGGRGGKAGRHSSAWERGAFPLIIHLISRSSRYLRT